MRRISLSTLLGKPKNGCNIVATHFYSGRNATNKQDCVDVSYGVLGTVIDSSINDSAEFYTPIGIYDYASEYAREPLAAEGYENDDIVLHMITFNSIFDTLLAEAVQAYLADVSVVVNLGSYIALTVIPMLHDGQADMTLTDTGDAAYEASIPLPTRADSKQS